MLEREAFKRKVFISLPDQDTIKTFVLTILKQQINKTYSKISPICFLDFEQNGDFTQIIFDEIAYSNAIVAFIKDLNSNVLFEIGRATALGKPYIAIAPKGTKLPSLIKKELTIFCEEELPSEKEIKFIMDAIEKAVIRPSHRESLDAREILQRRLLSGVRSLTTSESETDAELKMTDGLQAYRNAQKEFRNGEFIKAINILDKSIREGYKLEPIYHLTADCFFLLGEGADTQFDADKYYDEMHNISQEGLILFPKSNAIRKDYALSLQKSGHYLDAKSIFDQLLIESHEPVYLYNLACLHSLMSNRIECLNYLEQAIIKAKYYQTLARMDPDFENMWESKMFQALIFQWKLD